MMYRNFTMREKVLLLILAIMLVGMAYYMAIQTPVSTELTALQAQRSELQAQILVAETQQVQLQQMQAELDTLLAEGAPSITEVPQYDNLEPLMNLLNNTLASTLDYSVQFDPVDLSQQFVRRNIRMTFTCPDYNAAKSVAQTLAGAPFRNQVSDLSLAAAEKGVSVNLSITFFEAQKNAPPPPAPEPPADEE